VSSYEDREQRREVNEELYELLFDEDLAEEVLVVHGDVTARVAQVLARLEEHAILKRESSVRGDGRGTYWAETKLTYRTLWIFDVTATAGEKSGTAEFDQEVR